MNGDAHPFTKAQQLARGERRYRRKVASPKQWQALSEAKRGPCRVCSDRNPALLELHHLVSRQDHGDDLADNLVPLCRPCHDAITRRVATVSRLLGRLVAQLDGRVRVSRLRLRRVHSAGVLR